MDVACNFVRWNDEVWNFLLRFECIKISQHGLHPVCKSSVTPKDGRHGAVMLDLHDDLAPQQQYVFSPGNVADL